MIRNLKINFVLTVFLCWLVAGNFVSTLAQSFPGEPLISAFSKIIPKKSTQDPLTRLRSAYAQGPAGRTELEQVLKDHHATSLKSALQELDGILNERRTAITSANLSFEAGNAPVSEVEFEISRYSARRLEVAELAALISFYKSRFPSTTALIEGRGLRRLDCETARLALSVTKFPFTPVRVHDQNHPQIAYSSSVKKDWTQTINLFINRGLYTEFLQLWSQMVNQNSGNKRFRHIESFEDRFLWALRRYALQRDALIARDILVAYLSNFASNQLLDRVGADPKTWDARAKIRVKNKLSEFIAHLAQVDNAYQLRRFFRTGQLPDAMKYLSIQNMKSLQLKRVFEIIRATASLPSPHQSADRCIQQLISLRK